MHGYYRMDATCHTNSSAAKPQRTRGEKRFASLTYSLIAEWSGLSLSTVQSYGARGTIPKHDLAATLQWINARRALDDLPLIGMPEAEGHLDAGRGLVATKTATKTGTDTGTDSAQPAPQLDRQAVSRTAPGHPAGCKCNECWAATVEARRAARSK